MASFNWQSYNFDFSNITTDGGNTVLSRLPRLQNTIYYAYTVAFNATWHLCHHLLLYESAYKIYLAHNGLWEL